MKNPWKFQSIERLSSKISNGSNNSSPLAQSIKFDSFPSPEKNELESFSMTPIPIEHKQQTHSLSEAEKQGSKPSQNMKFQELPKKSKEREEVKKNKGLSAKMKVKLQEQLKIAYKQLDEKEGELGTFNFEIENLRHLLRQRKRLSEDLINNEQMLLFKQKQLNNLITIHTELLEGAKKDIFNEKNIKVAHEEKIIVLKKKIAEFSDKFIEKKELHCIIQKLKEQKAKLEALLQSRKQTEAKKSEIKSEAIRQLIHDLIKKHKKQVEEDCEYKTRIIRESSTHLKKYQDLRPIIQKKNITPRDYYTFAQLKYVPELNFRVNKDAQRIMEMFYREVNPKIPEIIEHFEEPQEFIKLRQELANLQKVKIQKQNQLKKKQPEVQHLQEERDKLKKLVTQLKEKTQIK